MRVEPMSKSEAIALADSIRADYLMQQYTAKDGRKHICFDVDVMPSIQPYITGITDIYFNLVNKAGVRLHDTRDYIMNCP